MSTVVEQLPPVSEAFKLPKGQLTAPEVYQLWEDATAPTLSQQDKQKAINSIGACLESGSVDAGDAWHVVFVASFLRPVVGDDLDIVRLTNLLEGKAFHVSRSHASKPGAKVYTFDDARFLADNLDTYAKKLGVGEEPTQVDLDKLSAIILADDAARQACIDEVDPESDTPLDDAFALLEHASHTPVYLPTSHQRSFARNRDVIAARKQATVAGKKNAAPKTASATSKPEHIDLDEQATKFLLQGLPRTAVYSFHLDTPEGYWDYIATIIDDEDVDGELEAAYEKASAEFNFHPSMRKM